MWITFGWLLAVTLALLASSNRLTVARSSRCAALRLVRPFAWALAGLRKPVRGSPSVAGWLLACLPRSATLLCDCKKRFLMNDLKNIQNITLGEWLNTWFEIYKKPYLKKYSLRNIEQMIRLHTPEWLKKLPMVQITIFDIDRALSKIPLGRTRVYARQVWHSAFLKAEKLGIISRNVVLLTDRIKYKKKKSRALTIAEQTLFLQRLEESPYKWLFLFYLYSGVRRAEALMLEWSDINEADGTILIKGTKTEDSYRFIILTTELRDILHERKKQASKLGQRCGLVFPFSAENVSKTFKKLCPKSVTVFFKL